MDNVVCLPLPIPKPGERTAGVIQADHTPVVVFFCCEIASTPVTTCDPRISVVHHKIWTAFDHTSLNKPSHTAVWYSSPDTQSLTILCS